MKYGEFEMTPEQIKELIAVLKDISEGRCDDPVYVAKLALERVHE